MTASPQILSSESWALIAKSGSLTDECRARIEEEFGLYRRNRTEDFASPETVALVTQIRGWIAHLNGLVQKLVSNDEYRNVRSYADAPKADVTVLSSSINQLALLDDEMASAENRLSGLRHFEVVDPLIEFLFAVMLVQGRCLKRLPPTAESNSSHAYRFALVCAELVEPELKRRFPAAFRAALQMFKDVRDIDPEDWQSQHEAT